MRQIKMCLAITDNRQPITRRKAFTLIELLVVIAIIGILATIVIFNVIGAQAKARDSKRMSDLNSIAKAVQLYNQNYDTFQICDGDARKCGAYDMGYSFFNIHNQTTVYLHESINQALVDLGYLSGTVIDPTGGINSGYYYMYFYKMGAPKEKGSVLARLETDSHTDPSAGNTEDPSGGGLGWKGNGNMNYAVYLIP